MPIEIRSKDFSITDAMRVHVERRMRFALDYLAIDRIYEVSRVIVLLGDLNGPRGVKDKFCCISAEVGHRTVAVKDIECNLYSAISCASHLFALKACRVARATGWPEIEIGDETHGRQRTANNTDLSGAPSSRWQN
jgi:ribosome-associated translation inhibitor RaiA